MSETPIYCLSVIDDGGWALEMKLKTSHLHEREMSGHGERQIDDECNGPFCHVPEQSPTACAQPAEEADKNEFTKEYVGFKLE